MDNYEKVNNITQGYADALEYDQRNREEATSDLLFRSGEQWDREDLISRQNAKRPSLVLDKVGQYVRKIVNQMNAQNPSLRVHAADETADPEMTTIFEGAIRDIEHSSNAKSARIKAHEDQVSCGIGHYRIKYVLHPRQPYQVIKVAPIKDPLSVVWDPASIEIDRSDARYCYVLRDIPLRAFKEKFKGKDPVDFAGELGSETWDSVSFGYGEGQTVRVAEYWEKYKKKHNFIIDQQGMIHDVTGMDNEAILGFNPVEGFKRDIDHVRYSLVSGNDILEEIKDYPCEYIPIIPVIGEEISFGSTTHRQGIIRQMKDPARLYNYMMSIAMEQMGQSVKSPYLVTNAMIKGNEEMWRHANMTSIPYLAYMPDREAPSAKPERVAPPQQHREQMMAAQSFLNDMAASAGMYDEAMGKQTNAKSGVAIQARQRESQITTNNFAANFAASIRQEGRVVLSLIQALYTQERRIRIVQSDGKQQFIDINKRVFDPYKNEVRIVNNMTYGAYEVRAELGASYGTIKQDSLNALMEIVKINPQMMPFLMPQLANLIETPNADELKEAVASYQQMAFGGGQSVQPNNAGAQPQAALPAPPQ